jgi:hypothetical protein
LTENAVVKELRQAACGYKKGRSGAHFQCQLASTQHPSDSASEQEFHLRGLTSVNEFVSESIPRHFPSCQ